MRTQRDVEVPDRATILSESTKIDFGGAMEVAVWFMPVMHEGARACAVDMARDINRAPEPGAHAVRSDEEDIQRRLLILTKPMLERMLAAIG